MAHWIKCLSRKSSEEATRLSVQVRAPRQKGANAISPGTVTDPQIMLKAPQVQDSICIAIPSEEKNASGKRGL